LFQSDGIGRADADTFPATGTSICIYFGGGRATNGCGETNCVRFAGFTAGATKDTLTGQAAGINSGDGIGRWWQGWFLPFAS